MQIQRFPKHDDIQNTRESILDMITVLIETLESMSDEDLSKITIENRQFWYIINGPVADTLTHVGQINSFRRLAGNPTPKANVFLGLPSNN